MKVTSTYLRDTGGVRGTIFKVISSKYSMKMFAITVDKGEPIAKPSSSQTLIGTMYTVRQDLFQNIY